jgi:DNA-binding CsgD family transcriptional regulator
LIFACKPQTTYKMTAALIQKLLTFWPKAHQPSYANILATLTEREIMVLCHLIDDPTDEQVAQRMCITAKSVANYKNRIGDKLDLKGRRSLMHFAMKHSTILQELAQLCSANLPKPLDTNSMSDIQAGGAIFDAGCSMFDVRGLMLGVRAWVISPQRLR